MKGKMVGPKIAAMVAAMASTQAVGVADLAPKRPSGLKPSRGRGNQGDWVTPIVSYAVSEEHREHNAAIEAKRQAKLAPPWADMPAFAAANLGMPPRIRYE